MQAEKQISKSPQDPWFTQGPEEKGGNTGRAGDWFAACTQAREELQWSEAIFLACANLFFKGFECFQKVFYFADSYLMTANNQEHNN